MTNPLSFQKLFIILSFIIYYQEAVIAGGPEYEIDLEGLASGLYIINLVTNEKLYGTKLVKL